MLALDHIVIAAKDPQDAAKQFSLEHNVQTISGGKHENWGTFNHLAYFSNDCYVEWLGIFNEKIANEASNPLIHQLVQALHKGEEGPIQFAFRTNNMEQLIQYFEQASIPAIGPIPGKRQRPDGSNLSWKMLFPKGTRPLPFLIEWGEGYHVVDNTSFINSQIIAQVKANLPIHLISAYYKLAADSTLTLANTELLLNEQSTLSFVLH
ncbi:MULTISPECIES: VOC family protein [Clostridia]|uniref:VOC family protein n=1 Tax=Clostridia TaxID=186801 RepID=UPI0013142523|nr:MULTISPECIES: VOC family protein [Clostridia]